MAADISTSLRLVRNLTQTDIEQADSTLLASIAEHIEQLQYGVQHFTPDVMQKMIQLKHYAEQTNLNVLKVKNAQELEEQIEQRQERSRIASQIKQIEALYQAKHDSQLTDDKRSENARKMQEQQRFAQEVAKYMAMSPTEYAKLSPTEQIKAMNILKQEIAQNQARIEDSQTHQILDNVQKMATNLSATENEFEVTQNATKLSKRIIQIEQQYPAGAERERKIYLAQIEFMQEIADKNTRDQGFNQLSREFTARLAEYYGKDPNTLSEKARQALYEQMKQEVASGHFNRKIFEEGFVWQQLINEIQKLPELKQTREEAQHRFLSATPTEKETAKQDYLKAAFAEMAVRVGKRP